MECSCNSKSYALPVSPPQAPVSERFLARIQHAGRPMQLKTQPCPHMSKLLKGGYIRDYIGSTIGVNKGDTRSLDYGSHVTSDGLLYITLAFLVHT